MNESTFKLIDVQKSYNDSVVFAGTSASIPLKGITAIVGPSGGGKSTLLRLLTFLERPNSGSIELQCEDRPQFNTLRPWPDVTCVFQKLFLWPHLTLRANILLPMKGTSLDRQNRLRHLIRQFEMESFIDRFPNEVSGGQAQRAAIARAFGVDPKVLLLDEIHNNLDIGQQAIVNRSLAHLSNSGVSVVVITHSLGFVEQYASRVVVVRNGDIAVYPATKLREIPYIGETMALTNDH